MRSRSWEFHAATHSLAKRSAKPFSIRPSFASDLPASSPVARGPRAATPPPRRREARQIRVASSFDHLVGEREQSIRHVETERLGGLEIDHELELGRLHHRQISRLLALEYSPGIDADLAVSIGYAGRVAHQTTGRDKLAQVIDRGNRMPGRQRDNPFPMREHERASTVEQRTSPMLDERCKGGLDVAVAADIDNDEFLPDRSRHGLN